MQLFKQQTNPDHKALVAELYTRYAPAIMMYIRRQILSQEDVEDTLLEVFTVALESKLRGKLNEYKRKG